MATLLVIAALAWLALVLVVYACIIVGGRSDDVIDRRYRDALPTAEETYEEEQP